MNALLLSMLLAAGPGASMRAGVRSYTVLQGSFSSVSAVDTPGATMHAPHSGTVTYMHGEVIFAGADGVGSTLTLAIKVDGVVACSVSVPCASTGDVNAACAGDFAAGQDVHMEIDSSACDVKPTLIASATIVW